MKLRLSLLVAIGFIILVGMSSCVRTYTCQCYISYSGQPGLPDTLLQEYQIKGIKSQAKTDCQSHNMNKTTNGVTANVNCDLY